MRSAILRTLAYADIFDYPLTLKEIHKWLIGTAITPNSSHNYYYLPNRQHLVSLRHRRFKWSLPKIDRAKQIGEWLKFIPWVKCICITGALAMRNSDENDDIDLMIITSANRLWLTRLLVTILTEFLGIRRHPSLPRSDPAAAGSAIRGRHPSTIYNLRSKIYTNKICLNLWLDETSLSVPKPQRNLYTAHEVAQAKPIINKNSTYAHFLSSNSWLNNYLPNVIIPKHPKHPNFPNFPNLLNLLAFKLQYWYMKRRMTREKVSLHFAFFHPQNTSQYVMREYNKRLKQLNIK